MVDPEIAERALLPNPVETMGFSVFLGRVGTDELVQVENVGLSVSPEGFIGLSGQAIVDQVGLLDEKTTIWISPEVEETVMELAGGGLSIDTSRAEVRVEGQIVKFTRREYDLLRILAENRNRVVAHEDILVKVWKYESGTFDKAVNGTIRTHIKRIRDKVGPFSSLIKVFRSVGYMFDEMSSEDVD